METKYIVNNATGQTINGDLTINGNVVITGTTNTRPYKVYTALLTQTGNTNPDSFNGGELIVGTSYRLQSPSIDADFTNVGAPNNNDGTWFIATGVTPNNWGTGTVYCDYGAPVVRTVLENTIGNIWFEYYAPGLYSIYSDSLFISDKTFIIGSMWGDDNASPRIFGGYYSVESNLIFGNGSVNDNFQINLEIRVYN